MLRTTTTHCSSRQAGCGDTCKALLVEQLGVVVSSRNSVPITDARRAMARAEAQQETSRPPTGCHLVSTLATVHDVWPRTKVATKSSKWPRYPPNYPAWRQCQCGIGGDIRALLHICVWIYGHRILLSTVGFLYRVSDTVA